jgi:hypothetical protein
MALRNVLQPFFADDQFRIIKPGDGTFIAFGAFNWHPVSVLAKRGSDIYAPFVMATAPGAGSLFWLRREVEAAGFQLISVQPTERVIETILKRCKAKRRFETIGGANFEIWRIPRRRMVG